MASFDGVDLARVKQELDEYVSLTTPHNASGNGFITMRSQPQCGRPEALRLTERVRPILDRLYPEWREDNASSGNFEFLTVRDACAKLRARIDSREDVDSMLGGADHSPRLPASGFHELVWSAASAQWSTGHRQEAVLAASKAVNSVLQSKLGRRDLSDTKLVQEAFSNTAPAVGRARLRFPGIEDEQTRTSVQQGVMSFGAGCFQAIRNPVGHLPNEEHELTEQEALERLAALSLLARWIDQATLETA